METVELRTLYATKKDLPDPTMYGFSLHEIEFIPEQGIIKLNRDSHNWDEFGKWKSYMREVYEDIMIRLDKMDARCS